MTKKYNQYLGKAGHLTVMSELLIRGWNVAIPQVDVGDDIFVVEDEKGVLRRVQVKTSKFYKTKNGYSGRFQVPIKQLNNVREILIHYVFIVRTENGWSEAVIIDQQTLFDFRQEKKIGSPYQNKINLNFIFANNCVKCSGINLTEYVNNFRDFPLLEH